MGVWTSVHRGCNRRKGKSIKEFLELEPFDDGLGASQAAPETKRAARKKKK
jgi:hypothetical protein